MGKRNFATRKDRNVEHEYICYKYRIYPTEVQKAFFAKSFGCVRFLWNRFVGDGQLHYATMGTVLHNTPADYKEDYPFLKEVDSLALCNVQQNYQKAMSAFFAGDTAYPTFKKKGVCRDSYTTNVVNRNIVLDVSDGYLQLPKLPGKHVRINLHRKPQSDLKLKAVTVSRDKDDSYYVSLQYQDEVITKPTFDRNRNYKAVGLDMAMRELFVSSDGMVEAYPRFYRQSEERLAKEQRKLSHMVKGSNHYNRQKQKVARIHAKIKHQRMDFLQKLSTWFVNTYDIICIEDLDMHAMAQALHLGKSVHDNGWGMFVHMLEYKARRAGKYLVKINRWTPSSQTCSVCGYQNKKVKDLSVRKWICPCCGTFHDRDRNAAINIREEGLRILFEELNQSLAA